MVGAWGGYSNGRIPQSALRLADDIHPSSSFLREDAATQFARMRDTCMIETGIRIVINEGYRTIDTQWYYWNLYQSGQGNVAAYPGNSNHGWALAVDLENYDGAWTWLQNNAARFGWDWSTGRASGERWHWEYIGGGSGGGGGGSASANFDVLTADEKKRLQTQLGVAVDGDIGPETIKALQKKLGVTADGDFGPESIKALQRAVAATVDGIWGNQTSAGLKILIANGNLAQGNGGTASDPDVLEAQKLLNQLGYKLTEDGIKGEGTAWAIRDFQTKNGLTVDGIFGEASKAKAQALIAANPPAPTPGDPDVLEAQQLLNKVGYKLKEDGVKGADTLAAIKDFQSKNGLEADGIAGPATKAKLREIIGGAGNPGPTPSDYYRPTAVSTGTLFGIDISRYQAGFNFTAYKSGAKEDFIILKRGGSNAGTYIDSKYAEMLPQARATGLKIGHYWFNGREGVASPTEAANFFLKNFDIKPGEIVALDIESEGTMPHYSADEALEWLKVVEKALGIKPFVYMSASVARQDQWGKVKDAGYPLWVAMYSYLSTSPNSGKYLANDVDPLNKWGDGNAWLIHQYTSTVYGSMPGTASKSLDRNIAKPSAFAAPYVFVKVPTTPDPEPEPEVDLTEVVTDLEAIKADVSALITKVKAI